MITIFDLETTGINPWEDRIVSIYATDGRGNEFESLINPGIPIPPEASVIHGITDEMVKDAPAFRLIAEPIRSLFVDKVLCGYNSRRYDTIMIHQEYVRSEIRPPFELETVQEIDVLAVWRSVESHNLSSAVRRWLNRDHEGAHGSKADAVATWDVLREIRKRYDLTTEDCLKRSMEISRSPSFVIKEGEYYFTFGMHRGKKCLEHTDYLQWMINAKFDSETKRIARSILGHPPL